MKFRPPRPKGQPNLGDLDLDPKVDYCIACGSQQLESARLIIQRMPTIEYRNCQTCSAKFVDRQPTKLFLSDYYQPDRYLGTVAGSKKNAHRFAKRILSKSVRKSLGSLTHTPKILDFGGGTGQLGIALRNSLGRPESNIIVMDLHAPIQKLDIEYVPSDRLNSLQSEQFDLVVASAAVEHLKRPGSVLQGLYASCATNGFMYFRVPSNFPLSKLFPSLLLWPEHLSHLGPRFWDQIPKVLGWSVKTVYSRPSIPDSPLSLNPVGYLASTILKIPSRIEVAVREKLTQRSIARYECAGGWEVMYQRIPKDSERFALSQSTKSRC